MKAYLADIIPKIKKFSKKLEDLVKLEDHHWVSLNDIEEGKKVYIFRSNNQLLISQNGKVEKGSWEYLGNESILLETNSVNYLLKHGFFDENILTLKIDSTEDYLVFVNESRFGKELNNVNDVLAFLEINYLTETATRNNTLSKSYSIGDLSFYIVSENNKADLFWGNFKEYSLEFSDGLKGEIYKGESSQRFFYMDNIFGKAYFHNFEEALKAYHRYLVDKKS